MPDLHLFDPCPNPSTLDRMATLEHLVLQAREGFRDTDPGVLWDSLVDALNAIAPAVTIATAVTGREAARPRGLVCATCGHHLHPDASTATHGGDYLFERAHHERGDCDKRSDDKARP